MSSRVNCSIITVAGSASPHLGNLPKSGTIEKKNISMELSSLRSHA